MTCRDDEKGQHLYKELCEKYPEEAERFFYHQLDITDEASITAFSSVALGWPSQYGLAQYR